MTAPTTDPITAPAIAPPLSDEEDDESGLVGTPGVEELDVEDVELLDETAELELTTAELEVTGLEVTTEDDCTELELATAVLDDGIAVEELGAAVLLGMIPLLGLMLTASKSRVWS